MKRSPLVRFFATKPLSFAVPAAVLLVAAFPADGTGSTSPPIAAGKYSPAFNATASEVRFATRGGQPAITVRPPIRHVPARNPAPPDTVAVLPVRPGIVSPRVAGYPEGYIPCDLYDAYGLNNSGLNGAGTTIAIIDAYAVTPIGTDLANFDATFGLPDPPSFNVFTGSSPTSNLGWADEITLDVEWAHAIAPGASIALVLGNTASIAQLMGAVDFAVTSRRADVVSMSFSSLESDFGSLAAERGAYGWPVTNGGGHPVTYLAATGDNGWQGSGGGALSPGWPGTDSRVVAVGGSSLAPAAFGYASLPGSHYSCAGATRIVGVNPGNETVWGNQSPNGSSPCTTSSCSGTGGGASIYEPRPAYQAGVTASATRVTPDVAMLADPATGVALFESGSWFQGTFGGTSLATPLWAGVVALLDQGRTMRGLAGVGVNSPSASWVYSGPTQVRDFNDIQGGSAPPTSGAACVQSGQCVAQTGYDEVTGRGSPLWASLLHDQVTLFVSLGGAVTSAPGATSWAAGRLDVFARGADNTLEHRWYSGGTWSGWESLGGVLTSEPGLVTWAPNRLDVFVRGTDNALWHRWWSAAGWSGWESLGGVLTSGPAVAAWAANRLDVVVRGMDGAVWHRWWDGSAWSGWESLSGSTASSPTVASWGRDRLDVFVRGTDDALWHRWYSHGWSGWESIGGGLSWGPAATSKASGRLDIIVRGTDGALYQTSWNGGSWVGYAGVGGGSWSTGAAVTSQAATWSLDLFTTGSDGAVWHAATT